MRDRVVDRSAAHAAPALLEVRDWLLVALSFSTGIYEAISFLTFGKIFMGFHWMLSHAHAYAPVVPVIVTAAVIVVAYVALKPEERWLGERPA
jgi:hypothetical protein